MTSCNGGFGDLLWCSMFWLWLGQFNILMHFHSRFHMHTVRYLLSSSIVGAGGMIVAEMEGWQRFFKICADEELKSAIIWCRDSSCHWLWLISLYSEGNHQSINQTSIAPISPAKPGSVVRQPTEPGFAGDIGTIEVWLIDWLMVTFTIQRNADVYYIYASMSHVVQS